MFRFESVSSSLSEKIREEKNFQKATSRWEIIDFRTSSFSNISSEKEPSITLVVPSESEIKKDGIRLILYYNQRNHRINFRSKRKKGSNKRILNSKKNFMRKKVSILKRTSLKKKL